MKNNIIEESKIALETSFDKLNRVDFSKFSATDRAEFKQEFQEIIDSLESAKKDLN